MDPAVPWVCVSLQAECNLFKGGKRLRMLNLRNHKTALVSTGEGDVLHRFPLDFRRSEAR